MPDLLATISSQTVGAVLVAQSVRVSHAGTDLLAPLVASATAAAASASADAIAADLSAASALAGSRYFTSQAAGEAGSIAGQFFSHPDGAGGLVYRERTGGGSTIIAYAATQAQLEARPPTLASRAAIAALTIPPPVVSLFVLGYAASGDGGQGVYQRVGAEPSHTAKAQSVDGQWWELIADFEAGVRANQLGVFASADVTTGALADANASALNAGLVRYKKVFLDRPATLGHFYYVAPVYQPSNSVLWGDDMGVENDSTRLGTCLYGKATRLAHEAVVSNLTRVPANLAAADRNIQAYGFTVHGNKANQTGGNEWSHGVQAYSVVGGNYMVRTVHCKGDGFTASYGYSVPDGASPVPCYDIVGGAISEDCERMGISYTSCVRSRLKAWVFRAGYYGLDFEPDNVAHLIDDIVVDLYAEGCGVNGSGGRGGIAVGGVTGQKARNVRVNFMLRDTIGAAFYWREVEGLVLDGQVHNVTGNVFDTGANGGGGSSTVELKVLVTGAVSAALGRTWDNGGRLNGRVIVEATLATDGLTVQDYSGGALHVEFRNGSAGSGTLGLTVHTTDNMDFTGTIAGFHAAGIYVFGGSSGNRFNIEAGSNNTGTAAQDITEVSGCSNNVFRNLRRGTTVSLLGTNSWAQFEGNPGCRTLSDADLAAGITLTPGISHESYVVYEAITAARAITLSTTGAVAGDVFRFVRAGGAFDLTIGALVLAANQWGEVIYRGDGWVQFQKGSN